MAARSGVAVGTVHADAPGAGMVSDELELQDRRTVAAALIRSRGGPPVREQRRDAPGSTLVGSA